MSKFHFALRSRTGTRKPSATADSDTKKNRERGLLTRGKKSRGRYRKFRAGSDSGECAPVISHQLEGTSLSANITGLHLPSLDLIVLPRGDSISVNGHVPMDVDTPDLNASAITPNLINLMFPYEVVRLILSYASDLHGFSSERITLSRISSIQAVRRKVPPLFSISEPQADKIQPLTNSTVNLPSWYIPPVSLRLVCRRWKQILDSLTFLTLSIHHASRVLSLFNISKQTVEPFAHIQYLSIRLLTCSRTSLRNISLSSDLHSTTANIAHLSYLLTLCTNLRRLDLSGVPLHIFSDNFTAINFSNLRELCIDSESPGPWEGHMDSHTFGGMLEIVGTQLELLKIRGWRSVDSASLGIYTLSLPNLRILKITDSYPSILDLKALLISLSPSVLSTLEVSQFRLSPFDPFSNSIDHLPINIPIYLHEDLLPSLQRLAIGLNTLCIAAFNFPLPEDLPTSFGRQRSVGTPQRLTARTPLPSSAPPPPLKDESHPSHVLAKLLQHCARLQYLTIGGNIATLNSCKIFESLDTASEGKNLQVLRLVETKIKMRELTEWMKSKEYKERLQRMEVWTGWEPWEDSLGLQLECWKRGTELKVGKSGVW